MPVMHRIKTPQNGTREVSLTRGKAIRLFCAECCGWSWAEARRCPAETCPLWPYRPGAISTEGSEKATFDYTNSPPCVLDDENDVEGDDDE